MPRSYTASPVRLPENCDRATSAPIWRLSTLAPAAGGAARRNAQARTMRRGAFTDVECVPGGSGPRGPYRESVSSSRTAWKRLLSILPW